MDSSRLVDIIQCSYIIFMLFNKRIRMYYSLFVFRFYYKIIGLSFKHLAGRWLAGRGLTRLWSAGMGQKLTVWAGPGLYTLLNRVVFWKPAFK